MKRTIFLGAMIFFIGVALTACGGSKSAQPATDTTTATDDSLTGNFPSDLNDFINDCTNCSEDVSGSFIIADEELYLQAHGYSDVIDPSSFGNNPITQVFGTIASQAGDQAVNRLICGAQLWFDKELADLLNVDYLESECEITQSYFSQALGLTQPVDLASSYYCDMRFSYDGNGKLSRVQMKINTNVGDRGYDARDFRVYSGNNNYFVDQNDSEVGLVYRNGRYEMITNSSRVIGYWETSY